MRFAAFATDYDETLADHGRVLPGTEKALERLRASGRKLLLVTGRDLKDLLQVLPRVDLFHAVVAENGALLYLPDRKQERLLAEPPPERFAAASGRARCLGRSIRNAHRSIRRQLDVQPGQTGAGIAGPRGGGQRAAWSSFAESERSCSSCDAAR